VEIHGSRRDPCASVGTTVLRNPRPTLESGVWGTRSICVRQRCDRKAAASCRTPRLAEGFFQGGLEALGQESCGSIGIDDHQVFAADAEFVGDVDAGLVGKGHAWFEDGFAAVNEIGMLVDVEADAVADAMSEKFVAGSETGGGDLCASSVVDGASGFSGTRGIESGVLCFADSFESALHLFGGLAEDGGAGYVGLIAFDETAIIDQDDIAFL
jgi:hypothetical protein